MSAFDTLIIGEVALDTNVDYDGTTVQAIGGAVYYSGFAAANIGHRTAVLPKADMTAEELRAAFAQAPNVTVYPLPSRASFVTKNVYHTPDRERRTSTVSSMIDPYRPEEIPAVDAAVWHLAGLVKGDLPNELIPYAAKHAQVAIDVQCMLRCVENGGMVYHDWAEKKELLPYVRFLKTDAAEAEILTGLTDRAREIYTCPIRSRNLSGRTGRGDTTFAGYINERLTHDVPTALRTATALVSLKMETPGPFLGTRADVEAYQREFF